MTQADYFQYFLEQLSGQLDILKNHSWQCQGGCTAPGSAAPGSTAATAGALAASTQQPESTLETSSMTLAVSGVGPRVNVDYCYQQCCCSPSQSEQQLRHNAACEHPLLLSHFLMSLFAQAYETTTYGVRLCALWCYGNIRVTLWHAVPEPANPGPVCPSAPSWHQANTNTW